jgi:hypothetical protein
VKVSIAPSSVAISKVCSIIETLSLRYVRDGRTLGGDNPAFDPGRTSSVFSPLLPSRHSYTTGGPRKASICQYGRDAERSGATAAIATCSPTSSKRRHGCGRSNPVCPSIELQRSAISE